MQVDNISRKQYRNSLQCFRMLLKENGVKVFYTGLSVNTMREAVFLGSYFCKKTGHQKRECRKFDEWKKKNPHRKPGGNTGNPRSSNSRPPISCYNCGKEGHISRECRGERRNQGRRGNGGYGGGQMADMAKSMAAMQEVLKKLVPEAVFP